MDEGGNEVYNIFESFKPEHNRQEVWWRFGRRGSKGRKRRRDDVPGAPNALLSAIHMVMSLGLNDASVLALMIDD